MHTHTHTHTYTHTHKDLVGKFFPAELSGGAFKLFAVNVDALGLLGPQIVVCDLLGVLRERGFRV